MPGETPREICKIIPGVSSKEIYKLMPGRIPEYLELYLNEHPVHSQQ